MSTSTTEALFNSDAEQCVIGAILIDGQSISRIQDVIVDDALTVSNRSSLTGEVA